MTHARPTACCCKILILSQETKSLKMVDVHSFQHLSRCPDQTAEYFPYLAGPPEVRNQGGKVVNQEVLTECHLHLPTEGNGVGGAPCRCGRGDTWQVCDGRKRSKTIDNNSQGWQGEGGETNIPTSDCSISDHWPNNQKPEHKGEPVQRSAPEDTAGERMLENGCRGAK